MIKEPDKVKTPVSDKKQGKPNEPQTLNIEIAKYKSLHDILDSPLKVGCAILALLILTITIFVGIGVITITLKRMYPYNNIRTNALGATTMQNENKEITYWLFNTAELWANSGIKVNAGDVLTIRASGKSHTAIHHLTEDAAKNQKLRDQWVGTSGDEGQKSKRDKLRAKYRIFAGMNQDALIMQVVPEGIDMLNKKQNTRYLTFENTQIDRNENSNDKDGEEWYRKHKENFYYIGSEKVNLRINNAGVLHFAVNDIVLTDAIIDRMQAENNDSINNSKYTNWEEGNKKFFHFGQYPIDCTTSKTTQTCNEMTYYKEHQYYNAWFDDNLGSFLVIIEQNKH